MTENIYRQDLSGSEIKKRDRTTCPDDYDLYNFAADEISPDRKAWIENHLKTCDLCLLKAHEFAMVTEGLKSNEEVPVPRELMDRVSRQWEKDAGSFTDKSLVLVVRLIKKGIEILESTFAPGAVTISLVPLQPVPAFRGDKEEIREILVEHTFENDMLQMSVSISQDAPDSLEVRILLHRESEVLSGLRISLKKNGAILQSKKTDGSGIACFSRLRYGTYTFHIPAQKVEWQIELKPASD